MASHGGKQPGAKARRLGAEFGLGGYLDSWVESRPAVLSAWAIVALLLLALAGIVVLAEKVFPHDKTLIGLSAGPVFIATLFVSIPLAARRRVLHAYAAGIAKVGGGRHRVVSWDGLTSLAYTIVQGNDDRNEEDYLVCRLRDGAGTTVLMDLRFGGDTSSKVATSAERLLTRRLSGPLLAAYDAGQPVTIGRVTVDRSGIRSQAPVYDTRRWYVPWPQVQSVSASDTDVTVYQGTRGSRQTSLSGTPNGFLAQHVIKHAARQAGVPVYP